MVRIAGCGERWDRIGVIPPDDWRSATQAVVRGARVLASAGEPLVWLDEPCALAPSHAEPRNCLGLRIRAYTLVLLDPDEQLLKTFPLGGASAAEVSAWASQHGVSASAESDFPDAPELGVLVHIDRTISNVHHTLRRVADRTHGASPPRTDPATLETQIRIALNSREGESPRRIELGLSPRGDQGELFVRGEPLDGDAQGWRLPVADIAALSDVDAQATAIEHFFKESLEQAYVRLRRQWQSRRPSGPA